MAIIWANNADLRDAWENEERHFTPWLAQQENLTKLAEALGLSQLQLIRAEHPVGRFYVDILCADDEGEVIIENQLEKTDHGHLGQVITYAAGVKAKKIIWIAKEIQQEHAAAIEFLNENTGEELNFFAVQIKLVKVDHNFIPNFDVIVRPNNWVKESREITRTAVLTSPTNQLQLKYWTNLINYLDDNKYALKRPRVQARGWIPISLGRSGCIICLKVNTVAKSIAVELYLDSANAEEIFNKLKEDKDNIEKETGLTLDWQDLPNRHACRVEIEKANINLLDESQWNEYIAWHVETAQKFFNAFEQRILSLK